MEDLFGSRSICVLIPTYNNHRTLERVIREVLDFTQHLIVINDGSTDTTPEILEKFRQITVIHHPENRGKGVALRNGFAKASELGYQYAITIDSDGQHYASDLPNFIAALQTQGDALYIGSRNLDQENVPKKSSFGNRFSNFWFWFETGIQLSDTQSGFRLYPIHRMPKRYFTRKFEFEIEVIVRSAWKGIPVRNIPIQVKYDPSERVSHFRPFKDFTRISILNTVLVVLALLIFHPLRLFRSAKKKGIGEFLRQDVLGSEDSALKKSASVALGVFIGIAPFWGFQTVLVLALAVVFRLNKALAFAFSNVSLPPFIPIIILASLQMGRLVYDTGAPLSLMDIESTQVIGKHLLQYIIGSFTLAAVCAAIAGLISFGILTVIQKRAQTA